MARTERGRKRTWRFRLKEDTVLEVSAPKGPTEKQVRRRGRVSLVLGTLIAAAMLAGVAIAADTNTDASLSSSAALPTTVSIGSNSFTISVWATGNISAAQSGVATVVNKYLMATNGTITPSANSADRTTLNFTVDFNYSQCGAGPTYVQGCAQNPFVVNATLIVAAGTSNNTTGTLTVSTTGSPGLTADASPDTGYVIVSAPASDGTAPDGASVVINDGAAWTNDSGGNVSVGISAHDAVGVSRYRLATSQAGLDSASNVAVSPAEVNFGRNDLAFTLSAGEGSAKAVWARFCDAADNCSDASDTIGWDKTPPSISDAGVQSGTAGSNGWYVSAVVNRFQASDALSGLDAACVAAFPSGNRDVSTGLSEGASVTVSSGPCSDIAGNTNAGISSTSFKIDLTDPSVEITSPADGLTTIAPSITVAGTASDTPSGIDTVTVNGGGATVVSGTFSKSNVAMGCGSNTITAVATDFAGRQTSDSITVNRLCFGLQYLQPIDQSTSSPVINSGKYGRVIPVKVVLSLFGGGALDDSALAGYGLTLQMGVNPATCSGSVTNDTVEAYADAGESAAGTNLFRWDAISRHWIYNLDTKAPAGVTMTVGSCYRLDVYVSDGANKVKVSTSTYALFKPVK